MINNNNNGSKMSHETITIKTRNNTTMVIEHIDEDIKIKIYEGTGKDTNYDKILMSEIVSCDMLFDTITVHMM